MYVLIYWFISVLYWIYNISVLLI